MPAEVRNHVHALARRAKAHRGLTFTDSDWHNLDTLYSVADDDDDLDYDDDASSDSSEDSDYDVDAASQDSSSDDSHDDYNPDLSAAPQRAEIAGVDDTNATTNQPGETPGVDETNAPKPAGTTGVDKEVDEELTGVNETDTTGVDVNPTLEAYVNKLEAHDAIREQP
jgi:hypothetical protein